MLSKYGKATDIVYNKILKINIYYKKIYDSVFLSSFISVCS